MFNKILLLLTISFSFSLAHAAPLTVHFNDLADGNRSTSDGTGSNSIGEKGYQPYTFNFTTGLDLTVRGYETSGAESYAYMDRGNAGMGVCTILNNTQCNPSSDDNVSVGEYLRLTFNYDVRIESLTFNNNHDGGFSNTSIDIDGIVKSGLNGGAKTFNDSWLVNAGDFLDIAYVNSGDTTRRNHFYLETLVVSQVPEPSILFLMGSGLIGLTLIRRKRIG